MSEQTEAITTMIIWINGAFGAGKTTTSELLAERMPDARIFDPEDIGWILQKTFPKARQMDYQDLPSWRRLTIFAANEMTQLSPTIIIPMTLVVPDYVDEIFSGIGAGKSMFHHFFLDTDKEELQRRITNQVIVEGDPQKDEEVRQWRLAQIDRCFLAAKSMPDGTVFLNTNSNSPKQLIDLMMETISSK